MTTYRFTVLIESGMSEEVVRKQLERQLAGYPCVVKRFHTAAVNASYTRKVEELTRERDEARAALAFYADETQWRSPSLGFAAHFDPKPSPAQSDNGERARAALKGDKP